MHKVDLYFFEPEKAIIASYDNSVQRIVLVGSGMCKVFKTFNKSWRICLAKVYPGTIMGEPQVLFNSGLNYSLECVTYCNIGIIQKEKINEYFMDYPDMKDAMIQNVINNPYDRERDIFVNICKSNIHFLSEVDLKLLR